MRESTREWIAVYLKGLAMGAAHAVPGISGGTVALITGIYGRLISAVTSFSFPELRRQFHHLEGYSFSDMKDLLHRMDFFFLLVLGAGIVTAIVSVLRTINFLLTQYPIVTYGSLTGLIAFSALILYREVDIDSRKTVAFAIAGFFTAFMVSGHLAGSLSVSLPVIFLAGMLAVSALVLPGISGSLVLVIMGQYAYMAAALSEFVDALIRLFRKGSSPELQETAFPVAVFLTGAIVGLFTVSHSVKWALQNHRKVTLAFLVSMVLGGLRAPIAETGRILASTGETWTGALPEFSTAFLIGALVIYVIDSYSAGIKLE